MACFCAAGIAHFCKLPQLAAQPPVPAVFFCQWPGLTRRQHSAFLPMARIAPPPTPAIKNSPTRLCRFLPGQQIAPVFCAMLFFSTNQPPCKIAPIFTFFIYLQKSVFFACAAILRAFLAFYFRARLFKKQHLFCVCQKSGSILTTQKEGGFFILSHQNSTLN